MKNPKERKYIFYENIPELKRMRSVVLSKANGICEKCGMPARLVHHRDGKGYGPENCQWLPKSENCGKEQRQRRVAS